MSLAAEETVRRRTGGRSAKVREAVLRATLQALTELGYGGLTISEIARRSGVHASSIQRRWGALENVLLEAVLGYSEQKLPIPNTGSLRGDLLAFARSLNRYLATPLGETVLRTLAAAEDNPVLAANRAEIIKARYAATRVMGERAAERGELRPGIDPQMAVELLVAPLNLRKLTRQPIDSKFIKALVDTLLHGLSGLRRTSKGTRQWDRRRLMKK
jgi:AcrR family transcriptional regulator